MKFIQDLKLKFLKPKPKVTDYFTNIDACTARSGKNSDGVCIESCSKTFFCEGCGMIVNCSWIDKKINFNRDLPSILLIDDNSGMVSFLRDDVETILEEMGIDPESFNILEFSSKFAVYQFIATHQYHNGLNIMYAIIDITYGGTVQSSNGNIRLTGVDVFSEIYKANKDVKFMFYTGNVLNPYIRSNKELIDQFKTIYDDDINEYVIFKTTMTMDDRQSEIKRRLFS